ncbi:MAG TPA: N-acetyl-gamma-glutamyl-phosphate reductase [Nitrospinota bacterium]|nr:N-acetyl-gamma-glutamyl-phosphate reductase [Nitrospinota bacterium]
MIHVGIVGGSGYTGSELLRILIAHPKVKISVITSERFSGTNISEIFPSLKDLINIEFKKLSPEEMSKDCDLFFLALPHKVAMSFVPLLLKNEKRVIDLSADYRIKDKDIYKRWYFEVHKSPELLKNSVYGLSELNREKIKNARLVANPGCYSTSIILALAPIMKSGLIDLDSIIIDSKSGISGAGRKLDLSFHFPEAYNGVRGYKPTGHRHIPEIEQELSLLADSSVKISFVPHIVPMSRGMLSTIYVRANQLIDTNELIDIYKKYYQNEFFVRILEKGKLPDTHHVIGSNFCDIGLEVDNRNNRFIIFSAIDNLVKGASGQAVQNMNIMYNLKENIGLENPAIFP